MISVVISSCNETYYKAVIKNIAETIGVPYEIVKIENVDRISIASAYNLGIKRSKYNILCFCHEDILFCTNNWGKILIELFNEEERVALVGLAGTPFFSKSPASWWQHNDAGNIANVIQWYNLGERKILNNKGWETTNDLYKNVVAIDGMFMASRKLNNIMFDERIPGFHAYDIAYSIRIILAGWDVVVSRQILLEHFSNGRTDKKWYLSMDKFFRQYKKYLPVTTGEALLQSQQINVHAYKEFIHGLCKSGLYIKSFQYSVRLLAATGNPKHLFSFAKAFILSLTSRNRSGL